MNVEVETRVVRNPTTGGLGVLIQLPDGFVILKPDDGESFGRMIAQTAKEARAQEVLGDIRESGGHAEGSADDAAG